MKTWDVKVLLEPDVDAASALSIFRYRAVDSPGDTAEEALANIRAAIELCWDERKNRGEKIRAPSEVRIGSVVVNQ